MKCFQSFFFSPLLLSFLGVTEEVLHLCFRNFTGCMAYLQRRNIPRKQRLCSVCFQACSFSYIFCDHCSQWVHTNCDGIEDEKVKEFERLPPDFPYICRKCRCDDEGHLDYGRALQRLHKVDLSPVDECVG